MKRVTMVGLSVGLFFLSACVAETDPEAREDEATQSQAITGQSAFTSYTKGLLRLDRERGGRCTAFLVGRNLVLTAAHCVDGKTRTGSHEGIWSGMKWGYIDARLVYKPSESETYCLQGNCRDMSDSDEYVRFLAWWHQDFKTPGSTPGQDFAVLTLTNGGKFQLRADKAWESDPSGLRDADYLRIYNASSDGNGQATIHGYGDSSDGVSSKYKPRQGLTIVQQWTSTTIVAEFLNGQNWAAACEGDSGGPLIFTPAIFGKSYAAGIGSNTDHRFGSSCPERGDSFRYARIAPRIGLINSIQSWAGYGACQSFTTDDLNGDGRYYKCW